VAPATDFDCVVLLSSNVMDDTAWLTCPYCFEEVEVYIDPQSEGELIRDCDVCCRPWSLQVSRGVRGELFVQANRAQ
jgi:hypothetical protein